MSDLISENQNNTSSKKRLGRGLSSLLSADLDNQTKVEKADLKPDIKSAPVVNTQVVIQDEGHVWSIPVEKLRPNTQQPRQVFEADSLRELAASIREKGILQPITARRLDEKNFEIIAGERRWRAAQIAGLKEVPVLLKKVSDQDSLELAIIENIQRADLNPMDESEAYEKLLREYSLTQQQVADRVGKDRATVANALRLLGLPSEVKEYLRDGSLTSGHAKCILSLTDSLDQLTTAKRVVSEKLSVRATENLVGKLKSSKLDAEKDRTSTPELSTRLAGSLAEELQKLIGSKVQIDYAGGKGKLTISFYSDDQLTQLVERLRKAWQK